MKVVINCLSALRGGGQTYLINLLREFIKQNPACKVILISNTRNLHIWDEFVGESLTVYEASLASNNIIFRVLWEIFILPFFLKKREINSYYSPGGIMVTKCPPGCKSYTALRNMLPFDDRERKRFPLFSYIRFKLWILKHVFLFSYKMSDGVIFISNYSRDEVKRYIPSIEDKSTVIYHGINEDFMSCKNGNAAIPDNLQPFGYYLYVSILDVYKAQVEVIKEWLSMTKNGNDFPLILVGPSYNEYGEQVINIIKGSGSELVNYIGPIDYERLPSLYKNARALIFASSCECCPNILLEKLASGRPVISSNIMPMPEFGKDAVIYFDPYLKGSLSKAVDYLESEGKIEKYSKLSIERAKDFCWCLTTKNTFNYLLSDS
ncbi:glycosyltransferase family 4 protein [Vibrio vulnificus]|nr:glycosyltransferase family 1 protein [Vibrio vulnificus]MCA4010853.1 glycosyltransferase family 4 protein [Vibrio vulnificus]MDK2704664.1 glycosyltransferase family 1 protein [Vibrio vulnificus]